LSPWFSWENNALSDLGHSVKSDVAQLFNFGLLLCGFLLIVYSIKSFKEHAKYTSYTLVFAGFSLQLISTFDEVYGELHFLVSVLFFVAIGLASISYFIEKKSKLALIAFAVGALSWILYGLKVYSSGISVPEAVSAGAVAVWVVLASCKLYQRRYAT
jgi:hypothetical membrane protein